MRYVKYFVAMSLDASIARPDGGVEWLFTDRDHGTREFFSQIDRRSTIPWAGSANRPNEPPESH